MARRKKTKSRKKSTQPQHKLPAGFWSQVGALFLIAISIFYIVAWFGAGGPVLEWLQEVSLKLIGYAVFLIPLIFIYLAIEIFRAENNKIPIVMRFAAGLMILWLSGLFGLLKDKNSNPTGGWIGEQLNNHIMLPMVSSGVAMFIYILLVLITVLFLTKTSIVSLFNAVWEWARNNLSEEDEKQNSAIAKEANQTVDKKTSKIKLAFGGGHKNKPEENSSANKKDDLMDLNINAPEDVVGSDSQSETKPKKKGPSSTFRDAVSRDKTEEEKQALVAVSDPNWKAPSLDLLSSQHVKAQTGNVEESASIIKDTLSEFNINVKMEGVNIGPRVTQYTLKPPSGVKLEKISSLETNIAYNLASSNIRIEAPIPGKKAVGVEVPNVKPASVRLRGLMSAKDWKTGREPLTFAIGKDITGENIYGELNKMPHLMIAGQTGSGKSVMINTVLTSLLYRNSPSDMKLILVDPKQVEMAPYENIPHLLTPVINDPEKTISALKWAVNEMERRYKLLAEEKIRDIKTYNQRLNQRGHKISVEDEDGNLQEHEDGAMPYIVIVIDELADLMMTAARDVEALIVRLAQKARAVGIHLVLATQRPSVNVITGLIKANVPARIAFTVASQVDSRTIIDQGGAEKLLGNGDMLMKTAQMRKPKRVQGAFVDDDEVVAVTDYLRMQSAPKYNEEIISQDVSVGGFGGLVSGNNSGEDSMYKDALRLVVEQQKASTTMLQNHLRIGYARAARIIGELEENGIIGPQDGSRPRKVLISSLEELEE